MIATGLSPGIIIRDRILDELRFIQKLQLDYTVSDASRVHQIRKAMKRMRSLLRLIKNSYSHKAYYMLDNLLAKAANNLSAMRDSTVCGETFQALIANNPQQISEKLNIQIRLFLAENINKTYKERGRISSVSFYLDQIRHYLENSSYTEISFTHLLHRIDKSFIKARDSYKDAIYTLDTEIIHTWRKHCKYLFLQLKFSPALQELNLDPLRHNLNILTHELGEDHDLHLLEELLIRNIDLTQREFQKLHLMISKQRSKIRQQTFQLGESVFSDENIKFYRSALLM